MQPKEYAKFLRYFYRICTDLSNFTPQKQQKKAEMKTISLKELATEYNITTTTMRKWIALIPDFSLPKPLRLINPKQLERIYSELGKPEPITYK